MKPFEYRPREWWLEQSKDLYFFCKHILSRSFIDKFHDFGLVHKLLCRFLMKPGLKKLISMFRGSYKTTVLLGYAIWKFCWALAEGRAESIIYNTNSRENAEGFAADFRAALIENKFLQDLFPALPRHAKYYRKWALYKVEYKWVKLHVASSETKQVTRHGTIYINDDMVDDTNAFSEVERENIKRKWRLQKSIITKYKKLGIGQEIDSGTPYHPKDLMFWLMKENKRYEKFIIPYALREDGSVPDVYKRDGYLAFPEMFMWEDFDEKREDQGSALFASQYELRVIEEADSLCLEKWIQYWKWLPSKYFRIMIVDPAGTTKEENSRTGILVLDYDETATMYIVYAASLALTPMQVIQKMEELKKIYEPHEIHIEREKYSISMESTIDYLQIKLNLEFIPPNNKPKPARIYGLRQYLERGKILFGQGQRDFINLILNHSVDAKFDKSGLLDCLAYAPDLAPDMKKYFPEREVKKTHDQTFEDEIKKAISWNQREEFMDGFF